MRKIRNILAGSLASVLGLSMPAYAQTPEDTGYLDLSQAETFGLVHERAKSVSYDTWQKEILEYDGAAIILFNSNCNTTENAETIDRNLNIVYLQLMDKFEAAKVNNLPLKFAAYNVCGKSKADLLMVNGIKTRMYLDGKEIDRRVGGPTNENGIKASTNNMGWWINYALLGIRQEEDKDRDIILLYKGDSKLEEYPRSEIKN